MRYSSKLSKLTKRLKTGLLATAFVATQLVAPLSASNLLNARAYAAAGDNGDVKVHNASTDTEDQRDEPKVCVFYLDAFNFDTLQSVHWYIDEDTHGAEVLSGDISLTTGHGWTANQTLPSGQYKLYWNWVGENGAAKHKVFKVECADQTPDLTTQVSAGSVNVGDKVHDTATLTGDVDHGAVTGTVKFYLCGPDTNSNPDCSHGYSGTQVGNQSGEQVSNGQAVSDDYMVTKPGYYCFRATYHPDRDANYDQTSHTNLTTECFVATATKPSNPTVSIDKTACTPNSGTTDTVTITVTNTADNTGKAVVYTVTVNGQSKSTGTVADGSTGSVTFTGLSAGTYSASVQGDDGTSATSDQFTINSCPYLPATVKVTKVVHNYHGGNAQVSQFPLYVGNTKVTSGDTNTFTPGQYTVKEQGGPSGYEQESLSCKADGSNTELGKSFTLVAGENVKCTIVNEDVAPTLTLTKYVHGGNAHPWNWLLVADPTSNDPTLSGWGGFQGKTAVANTWYDLSEYGTTSGYSAGDWNCTGGQLSGNWVKLSLGEHVSCWITNYRDTGTVDVIKDLKPSTDHGKFDLKINGRTYAYGVGDGGSTKPQTTDTGWVTVSETAHNGTSMSDYASSYSCSDGRDTFKGNGTSVSFELDKDHNVVCTFTNVRYGSISGTKYEVNANGQHVGVLGGVQICIDGNHNGHCDWYETSTKTDNQGHFSFSHLLKGTYSLIENIGHGWTQIFGDGNVRLDDGENATHDFGNFENASISGYKWDDANGNGWKDWNEHNLSNWGVQLFGSNHQLLDTTHTNFWGYYHFDNLAPGWYTVCEIQQTGWTQTYPSTNWPFLGCHSVNVWQSGHDYDHNNFGNQGHGTITVTKVVNNNHGGKLGPNDFTLMVGKDTVQSGVANDYTEGHYSVSEADPTSQGYKQTGLTCVDNWQHSEDPSDFKLRPGEDITCTITNEDVVPQLTVIKHVDNNGTNLTKTADNFEVSVNGTNVSSSSFPGSESGTPVTLDAGSYTVSETPDSNYVATYSGDCDTTGRGTISVGQSLTCTITNTAVRQPAIHVEKSGPATAHAGDTVTYTFTVTNPGNVPLDKVAVSDDVAGNGATLQSGDTSDFGWLDPGETWIYTIQYKIPANQTAPIVNTVTACGTDDSQMVQLFSVNNSNGQQSNDPQQVCDTDTHTTTIPSQGHVLGASTGKGGELVNTGQSAIANVIAGLLLISTALGIWIFGRRQTQE